MPLSRGRKKKKKQSSSKKGKGKVEKFAIPGGEIVREGKNVFIRTNRTDQEQDELIARLKAARPEILKNLQGLIEKVVDIFSKYDKIQLLGMIACNMILKNNDPQDDGACELAMEYGQSFATAVKSTSNDQPTPAIGNELLRALYDIRSTYTQYVMTEFTEGSSSKVENHLRFKTIMESLYMRGDGYMQHIYRVFKELYAGHDAFLQQKYGFTSLDILDTFLQLEDSFSTRVMLRAGIPPEASYNRFTEWRISKGMTYFRADDPQPMLDFFADNPDIVVEDGKPAGYLISDITTMEGLYRIRYRKAIHRKVVEAVAIQFEENADFLNPNFKGLPLNDSLSHLKPIISHNGEHYVFAFGLLTRNIFTITEKLISDGDKKYYDRKFLGNDFAGSRDNYLENAATALFKAFIPNAKAHPNLKYRPGQTDDSGNRIETEADLVLESEKAVYIIEMKAGGLSAPSRRGALKSLTGQLGKTVGYGAYQSFRAYDYLKSDPSAEFYDDKGTIVLLDATKKIFRITITLEHLSGFLVNLFDLQVLGIVEHNVKFAWTCSLFDLIIFSEILDNEDDFIDYLEQRIDLYANTSVEVDDEIDFLGYYLDNGKLVDEKVLGKVSAYKLNKTSSAIDEYFQKGGPKPIKKTKR